MRQLLLHMKIVQAGPQLLLLLTNLPCGPLVTDLTFH
jgi:hypothetical protein